LCLLGGPGMTPCPAGFPTQTTVAVDVADTRGCGCDCGSTLGCTFQSLLLDNDFSCGASPFSATVSAGTCVNPTSNVGVNATQTNAMVTGNGACMEITPSMPTGGVALGPKHYTVCCP